ncbi:hypothetical protein QTH90_04680 [Variovorax sp. J2P1-59]|uniref:hypothetical protein n=1 Tax=Variovorax flavidus TaxID=3053501 RepID=UPI0025771135|nr:hypothetical protein [Variovorax sp. J2P1-59]MDM0073662.1 hypothetical protein [Variovorax sp. J2P1-59]
MKVPDRRAGRFRVTLACVLAIAAIAAFELRGLLPMAAHALHPATTGTGLAAHAAATGPMDPRDADRVALQRITGMLARFDATGDSTDLLGAFDRIEEAWTSNTTIDQAAAQAYVARYCGLPALSLHPFCNPAE